MIINPTSLTITQLLGSANEQYVIPAYQRRYSWHEKQLWELVEDISLLEGSDTHLLGSIVCLTGHHTAGMNRLELVDGQQRLTTVSILLQCILDRLRDENEHIEAQDVERLLQAKALGGTPVRKIALDSLDAAEFDQLAGRKTIEEPENPNLVFAFSTLRKWVAEKPIADLGTFLYRLKNQAIIIRLDVSDAKDAFKLFETINNRGLKLSATDIIKNFILGNAARFGAAPLSLARTKWAELIRNLDGTNSESFFRHFLCAQLKRRITVSYVITNFKSIFMRQVTEASELPERHLYAEDAQIEDDTDEVVENGDDQILEPIEIAKTISFEEFLGHLVTNAKIYGQIVLAKTGSVKIDRHLRNLKRIKSLQTYGFLMALRAGGCSEENYLKILRLTESFLLRRHVCRERSNENERVFARLCGIDCSNPIPKVIETYREFTPSDDSFRVSFAKTDFNPNLIDRARYCLEQFELDEQGNHLELLVGGPDIVHVEHIIPQKIKTKKAKDDYGDWPKYLGAKSEALHPQFVSRIGNLTLLSGDLNIGVSNNPYERKKTGYAESAFLITKSLSTAYPDFRFEEVDTRSAKFADLAVERWPAP